MLGSKTKKVITFKTWHAILLGVMFIVALGVHLSSRFYPKAWVKIQGEQYRVLVADTPERWDAGLSNRPDVGDYDGMLFIFSERAERRMVMRGMLFPLDILWIQGDTIVDMAPNLQPDPAQTEAALRVYPGRLPADMVL